jgi:DNA-binding NarL/FixJ family response regulator
MSAESMDIKVCIVEDNQGMRDSFALLLNQSPGMHCVSTYATGEAAVQDIPAQKPDVTLVDIHLPGMNGIECVAHLRKQMPQLQVLMLTRYEQSDLIFSSICAGASGYLLKNTPPDELIDGIKEIHAGGAPMPMHIARKMVEHFYNLNKTASEAVLLSPREQEILGLLSKGYLYKEIVARLGISLSTVRTHLKRIYDKLHVQTRTEATAKFLSWK